jgi:dihydrofolate reductase
MIKAIFAVDVWGGMGYQGHLPWPHHREDMKYFQDHTMNNIVVMGRRTWDDSQLPKPLNGRIVYVATNRSMVGQPANTISGDINYQIKKIALDNPDKTIWIIGGPDILMETRDITDEVYITHFKGQYRTDRNIDLRKYLTLFRVTSAKPSVDRRCNWMTYKNIDIFRSVL